MEANICEINHLDADVLLPPRKRLLAGFKKQASNANATSDQPIAASSTSSPSPPSPPSPSSATSSSDVDAHLNNLLSPRLNNPNLSPEEIFEASRTAAIAAAKAAEAARAAAEEKAAIAAKAIAAAKSALDMVATFSEDAGSKDRYLKKNKIKKHVPVQVLYKKHQPIENSRVDEDLAQRLHRAINRSSRISKGSPISEWKGHQHKRPKSLPTLESTKVPNGGIVLRGSPSSTCNGSTMEAEINSDDLVREHVKVANEGKSGQSVLDNGEAESGYSKEKACKEAYPSGKKRGTLKLKKLPLSVCSYRDRVNHKEEMITESSPLMEKNMGNPTVVVKPVFSSGTLC
ncbi:putative srpk [Hibiscus syriacus]|uniref:Srpk n=1 Tax=Hibiscus syriacus TaxID=106335 RepID=A0A6A3ALM3_HIBSY|nr:putative srpk [Hibiscus syriacus]